MIIRNSLTSNGASLESQFLIVRSENAECCGLTNHSEIRQGGAMNEIKQFETRIHSLTGCTSGHGNNDSFSLRGITFFAAGMLFAYAVIGF